jgi:hypothetical protein
MPHRVLRARRPRIPFTSRPLAGGHVRPWLRRWYAAVGAVVIASALALSGAGPAAAAVVAVPVGGGDGGDGGGSDPCADVSGSFTALPPSTMFFGVSYQVSWTTQRPTGCGSNISTMLIGPGSPGTLHVSGGGTETVTLPATTQGPATYRIAAFFPGGSVTVASVTVALAQGPLVSIKDPLTGNCLTMENNTSVLFVPPFLHPCDGSVSQAFRFWSLPDTNNEYLLATYNGLCLAANPNAGNLIQQAPCPSSYPIFAWRPFKWTDSSPVSSLANGNLPSWCMSANYDTTPGYTYLQECNFLNNRENWTFVNRT